MRMVRWCCAYLTQLLPELLVAPGEIVREILRTSGDFLELARHLGELVELLLQLAVLALQARVLAQQRLRVRRRQQGVEARGGQQVVGVRKDLDGLLPAPLQHRRRARVDRQGHRQGLVAAQVHCSVAGARFKFLIPQWTKMWFLWIAAYLLTEAITMSLGPRLPLPMINARIDALHSQLTGFNLTWQDEERIAMQLSDLLRQRIEHLDHLL